MGNAFFILTLIAMLAVVSSLAIGLYYMTRQGDENRKMSNKMMRLRVTLQGFALLMFVLAFMTSGS